MSGDLFDETDRGPFADLLNFIAEHPGLNGPQLAEVGLSYRRHGSLIQADKARVIVWLKGGWYVARNLTGQKEFQKS